MKIKEVRCEVYLREPPRRVRQGFPPPAGKVPFPILRIITDDGIEGFAFNSAVAFTPRNITEQAASVIRHVIIDKDPLDREWIWQKLWELLYYGSGGGPLSLGVLSAVDVALWDIAGKALGQPVYKLLGAYRDKVRVYASVGSKSSPQEYFDEVISCKQQGVTAYKIHFRGTVEEVIEVCRAARQAGGDDMTLMLDSNSQYTRDQALRVGKVLEELNFHWFEEPIPDVDIEGLIMLREKLDVPICATENAQWSMTTIPEYLLRRAIDIVRCDTEVDGGITPCKKIADMCNAFGMQCEIHLGGFPNLQVECAVKNCEFYEMFWPDPRRYGLKEYPVLDNEGYIHVPQKPGLGFEIDWEVVGKPVAIY